MSIPNIRHINVDLYNELGYVGYNWYRTRKSPITILVVDWEGWKDVQEKVDQRFRDGHERVVVLSENGGISVKCWGADGGVGKGGYE